MDEEIELGMSKNHREHINKNMEKLIRCTKYHDLVNACVRCRLITKVMRDNLEKRNTESHNISEEENELILNRRLFHKITKRGNKAYFSLKQIFGDLGYTDALAILDSVNDSFISLSSRNNNNSTHSSVNLYGNSISCVSRSDDNDPKTPDHVDTHSTFPRGAANSVSTVSPSPFVSYVPC